MLIASGGHKLFLFAVDDICFDVKILTIQHGFDVEWHIGHCDSVGTTYDDHKRYIQRCCLKPGRQILTCVNKRNPYGWGDGYIEIQGHRYCDDFMSYQLIQDVEIISKKYFLIHFN